MNEAEVERRARKAFYAETTGINWDELEEWKRESWRCDVDPSRPLDKMLELAKKENKGNGKS